MGLAEYEGFDLSGLSDEQLGILLPGLQAFKFPSRRIFEKTGKLVPVTVSDLASFSTKLDQRGHGHVESGAERGHLLGKPATPDHRSAALGLYWLPTSAYPAGRIEVGVEAMADPPLAVEVLIAEAAHAIDYGALTGKQRAEINRLFEPIGHQHAPDDRTEIGPDEWFEGHDADYWSWPGERWMSLCMAAYAPDLPRPLEAQQPWTHSYDASDVQEVLRICADPVPEPQPESEPQPEPTPEPDIHPATAQLLELFAYQHLPEHLQEISKPFNDLAQDIARRPTERGAEQTTCLRKLLEAKDCAVRMGVPLGQIGNNSPPLGG